ncbi:MAG: hydroxylamine reductase [Oscillospiraceae bacterium]|nr:hydroxylamine reductase [Oscillospiraceae bacterium]
MPEMFCFQCQQTAGNKGCVRTGVCGKQPETANLQDELVCALIRLAEAAEGKDRTAEADRLLMDGLFTTLTNVNFDNDAIRRFINRVKAERKALGGWDGEVIELWKGETDLVSLRSTLLFGLKGMAAYAHHSLNLGYEEEEVTGWFYHGLRQLNRSHTVEEWLTLIMEFGRVNYRCMALLDRANTESFGTPVPTRVNTDIKKGPFIVVSGHDLKDMADLLEQTAGTGINIYTHSEMLPAHGYPGLKKHPHLAGNFGTAWQSQQREFENIPAPVLFTTNCLMPPRPSYRDRIYTTSVVGYEGMVHIEADQDGRKDFTPLIRHALCLGGYDHDHSMSGINGGHMLTTGFAHGTVLAQAEKVVEAIRAGKIKHIFLVGGCDGAHPGRNYYTEFVKQTPMDSLILTLACGKYRFNDLDLGEIDGLPRIMDMGQCNDAYSAIRVALALADAFGCSVNELPLTLVLSWYEQKAVCILLTLLALGVKNIYLGPTLPAFLSESVVKVLVDTYGLQPVTAPEQDLDAILGRG